MSTREAVQALAMEHGYQPNSIASSLRKGKSPTIGVVIPRINRHFFSNVIGGMEEILNEAGFNLVICQSHESYQKEIANLKSLIHLRVEAVFVSLSATTIKSSHIQEIIDRGTRVIMFDRVTENIKTRKVVLDDYKGAYRMVEHMISQGYRNILHLGGMENIAVYRQRRKGFQDALRHSGFNIKEQVIPNVITKETGFDTLNHYLNTTNSPDAVFCASDFSALGSLLAVRQKNLRVPGQIGIAGFGNEPFTEYLQPGISTVDQKADLMGHKVAELFLNDENTEFDHTEIISPELMIRNSTSRNIN